MDFSIDLSGIPIDSPWIFSWWLFVHGGFIFVVVPLLVSFWRSWLYGRQHQYLHGISYILLAVDVPRETEQSPRAAESIFSALAATLSRGTLYDRLWKGKVQESFSFELVSLGGYIQFLIRTPRDYQDLIEASIYAQYPDAEVTEVHDYVDRIPLDFDTEAYDLWGTEFELMNKFVYPIRTYPEFEHELSQELKDPLAALLEVIGRINADEDVWLQWVVTPTSDHWKEEAKEEVEKLVKGGKHGKHGVLYFLFVELPIQTFGDIVETVFAGVIEPTWWGSQYNAAELAAEVAKDITKMTPGQRSVVEAIERKAAKLGFLTKFRLVYWGRRETFLKGRGVSAVVGAIQQFTALDRNGWVPSKLATTKAEYFLKQSRINRKQRSVLRAFKVRDAHRGLGHGFVMNTEELASMYHFPQLTIKAPLVKKTEAKKAEPPSLLPVMGTGYLKPITEPAGQPAAGGDGSAGRHGQAPSNLPVVE